MIAQQVDIQTADRSLRLYMRGGYMLLGLLAFFVVGWGAFSEIAGAVTATGTIAVESNLRKIQHKEGGVIADILVSEGDAVAAGQLLATLESDVSEANVVLVSNHVGQLTAKRARLDAQARGAASLTPWQLEPHLEPTAETVTAEQSLLTEHLKVVQQKRQAFDQQIVQAEKQIAAMSAQHASTEAQVALLDQQRTGIVQLYKDGFATLTRLNELELEVERLRGETGRLSGSIAATRAQVSELKIRRLQVDSEARALAMEELKDVDLQLAELAERGVTADDRRRRLVLRATTAGHVQQISLSEGGVLAPGDALMFVVPSEEPLILEARIDPQRIDQVTVGRPASIRLSSFDAATTPEFSGHVDRVSADVETDPNTGISYYIARVRMDDVTLPASLRSQLQPGMPADIMISTASRSALSYFLKPLTDRLHTAFREG